MPTCFIKLFNPFLIKKNEGIYLWPVLCKIYIFSKGWIQWGEYFTSSDETMLDPYTWQMKYFTHQSSPHQTKSQLCFPTHDKNIKRLLDLATLSGHTAWQWTVTFTNCKLNEAFLTDAGGTAPLGLTDGCHRHIKAMKSQTVIITPLKPHLSTRQFNSY